MLKKTAKKMKKSLLPVAVWLATMAGTGHLKPAPGTWGSAAAALILLIWINAAGEPPREIFIGALVILFLVGWWATFLAQKALKRVDPPQVVIDEWVGLWVAVLFFPLDVYSIVWAFLFFRLFDIWKPWPIGLIDRKLKNALGVMLDDVVAGLYAAAALYGVLWGLDSVMRL